jgi:hypothetical protein
VVTPYPKSAYTGHGIEWTSLCSNRISAKIIWGELVASVPSGKDLFTRFLALSGDPGQGGMDIFFMARGDGKPL